MNHTDYHNLKTEIRLYTRKMNKWWGNLQEDSVAEWILLTTFGCWGIPNPLFQLLAFIITLLFFTGKLSRLQRGGSFIKSEKTILEHIEKATLNNSERDQLLHRLNKVKKFRRNRNWIFVIRRNWRFLLGYGFMTASSVYYLFTVEIVSIHK
jgi:hypothetical protein